MLRKPAQGEYPPYYKSYIELVPTGDLAKILTSQIEYTKTLLSSVSSEQADFRYSIGKWSLKEVLGHIIDTERIMGYRLLRMARGDQTPLSGFDEELYVQEASFSSRTIVSLLDEFEAVRHSTVAMIQWLSDEVFERRGVANGSEITVKAIAYIIAGHELHHLTIIKERYLL